MVELLVVLGILAGGAFLALGLLKLLVVLLLIPFKIAFLMAKGFLGLFIVVPVLIVVALALLGTLPVVCAVLLIPLGIVAAVFVGIMGLFFG